MTLDEAIKKLKYDKEMDMYIRDIAPQLAEWLEELKSYREIGTVEECRNSVLDILKTYNKAIDEYKDKLCTFCKMRQIETKGYHKYPQCMIGGCNNIIIGEHLKGCHILNIAEQLKVGGENERM